MQKVCGGVLLLQVGFWVGCGSRIAPGRLFARLIGSSDCRCTMLGGEIQEIICVVVMEMVESL
jgi:hypothetical protein